MAVVEPRQAQAPQGQPAPADPRRALAAFRRLGYLAADLDPLDRIRRESHPALGDLSDPAVAHLREVYTGPIGVEFMHIPDPARRRWVAERMEGTPPAAD